MNYHRYFQAAARPVETCLIGTGDLGRSSVGQGYRALHLGVRLAVDVISENAAEAWRSVGVEAREIGLCETSAEARTARNSGA